MAVKVWKERENTKVSESASIIALRYKQPPKNLEIP